MVVRVASILEASSPVAMKPRSWAARVAKRPMPMFVGDVRWATRGSGVSWKLSGGQGSGRSAPMKVSK